MVKSPKPKVLVGMPAYNEAKYIGSLVLKARKHADEVIVLDDGSTDDTAKIAELAGATVVRHERNRGYGAAVQGLLAEAKRRGAELFILLDADSQHNPDDIPRLIKPISGGADLVIGSRKKQSAHIPTYRRFGQKVISLFSGVLSREKLADTESGFRAFSRKAVNLLELKETGMAVSAETIARAAEKGLQVTEAPISISYTKDGSTLNPVRHGVGVLQRIMVMISEKRPLLFFGLLGAILILLGIVAGIMVVQVLYDRQVLQVGTALISMLFITVGMLSIFVGIILDVLVRRLKNPR